MHGTPTDVLRTTDTRALGARVRAAREARGWTQTQLAGSDISVGYVSRIETGARRPTARVLAQLAERLGISAEELLEGRSRDSHDEIRLGLEYAEISLEVGETSEAAAHARSSVERAAQADHRDLEQRGHYLLGRALEGTGALNEAIVALEQATDGPAGLLRAQAAIALSRCYRDAGDLGLAVESGEAVEATLGDLGLADTDEAVQLAMTIAAAYALRGDLNRATRRCTEALERAERLTSPTARGAAYWNASAFREMQGDIASALPLARRALAHFREGQDDRNLARLGLQLSRLELQDDHPDYPATIARLTQTREALLGSSASVVDIATCDITLADAHLSAGDPDRAVDIAIRAREAVGNEVPAVAAESLVIQGRAAALNGHSGHAKEAYHAAIALLTSMSADRSAAQLWVELAELLEEIGDLDAARTAFRSAAAASGLSPRRRRTTAPADRPVG